MRVLTVGDVVGRAGRKAVKLLLPSLRDELGIDLVIANGENSAGGFGITLDTANEMLGAGVDVITSGNHIWDQKGFEKHMNTDLPVLRPINYPPNSPGRGYIRVGDALIINAIGRVFVGTFDCPFRAVDELLSGMEGRPKVVILDFHAETTSEKGAMGWYLDGRASAVVGTHTHVPTADTRILPQGTAFVSDLGMVGPMDSVIGSEVEDVVTRFLTQTTRRLRVVSKGPVRFNSVLIDIDDDSGKATNIERVDREIHD